MCHDVAGLCAVCPSNQCLAAKCMTNIHNINISLRSAVHFAEVMNYCVRSVVAETNCAIFSFFFYIYEIRNVMAYKKGRSPAVSESNLLVI